MEHTGPFSTPGVGRRTWPFLTAAAVAVGAAPATDGPMDGRLVLIAAFTLAAIVAAVVALPWRRLPRCVQVGPPLAMLLFVALVREGAGGSVSGYAALGLLPIIWLGLHGSRRELMIGFAGLGVTLAAPILIVGTPEYPPTEWRRLVVWAVVAPIAGLVVQSLIRERSELLATVERLSRTDALTGVLNRRAWDELAQEPIARADRTGPVTLAILDLDGFKGYNDRHGHPAGDRLLKAAAAAWQAQLRPGDFMARYGGDEFIVLLADCPADTAREVADRLRRATPAGATCSIGTATASDRETADDLTQRADVALYAAKRAGRDRAVVALDI